MFAPFFLSIVISWLSSLLHLISGFGDPLATHRRLTSLPSRTSVSELVSFSSMCGGTTQNNNNKKIKKQIKLKWTKYKKGKKELGNSNKSPGDCQVLISGPLSGTENGICFSKTRD